MKKLFDYKVEMLNVFLAKPRVDTKSIKKIVLSNKEKIERRKKLHAIYLIKNKERVSILLKEWRIKNPEKIASINKKCKQKIKEKKLKKWLSDKLYSRKHPGRSLKYYYENRERMLANQKAYNAKNPEVRKNYYLKNRDRILSRRRKLRALNKINKDMSRAA